jgi:hypothetical protein
LKTLDFLFTVYEYPSVGLLKKESSCRSNTSSSMRSEVSRSFSKQDTVKRLVRDVSNLHRAFPSSHRMRKSHHKIDEVCLPSRSVFCVLELVIQYSNVQPRVHLPAFACSFYFPAQRSPSFGFLLHCHLSPYRGIYDCSL